MIKQIITERLIAALAQASPQLNNLAVNEAISSGFRIERPRHTEHGDYAVNVSFLARHTRMAPPQIAEKLSQFLHAEGFEHSVMGGYLNFRLNDSLLQQALASLISASQPGKNESLQGERILLEYVSANPTGPLHIGHGRWAALGDSIARILRHNGAAVTTEFYINDAGVQMENITQSVYWRCVQILKAGNQLPETPSTKLPDTLPYPGDYVGKVAQLFLANPENQQRFIQAHNSQGQLLSPELSEHLKTFVRQTLLKTQQELLERMHVQFENWISEKEYLYDRDIIASTLLTLTQKGFTYEADDALWFKSTEFGDEKDRVLRKSDGTYTYLMPDIAYHDDKFKRSEGFNRLINIWGADHHGYIPRMRGAIQALGHNPDQFEVLLGQLVNLIIDGERTRMGKRRKMLTLLDVVDEVGVDATRFWMVSKSADSTLDFDVELAATASSENPVFYVQYAHARCCSILRNAVEPSPNVDTGEIIQPFVAVEALSRLQSELQPQDLTLLFSALDGPKERSVLTNLVLLLDNFEDVVRDAARIRAPHFLTQYAQDVSAEFHSFYNLCRILTAEPSITQARLALIIAIRKTLAQALELLGVTAPEKM